MKVTVSFHCCRVLSCTPAIHNRITPATQRQFTTRKQECPNSTANCLVRSWDTRSWLTCYWLTTASPEEHLTAAHYVPETKCYIQLDVKHNEHQESTRLKRMQSNTCFTSEHSKCMTLTAAQNALQHLHAKGRRHPC